MGFLFIRTRSKDMEDVLMLSLEANLPVPMDEAFAYITHADHLPHWLYTQDTKLAGYYWKGKLDSEYLLVHENNNDGEQYRVAGIIQEFNEPENIGFSWVWIDDDNQPKHAPQYVRIILEDYGDGTKLNLFHLGIESEAELEMHKQGWADCLQNLENYITEE